MLNNEDIKKQAEAVTTSTRQMETSRRIERRTKRRGTFKHRVERRLVACPKCRGKDSLVLAPHVVLNNQQQERLTIMTMSLVRSRGLQCIKTTEHSFTSITESDLIE